MATHPIDGQPVLLAAAKASVPPDRLPDLLRRVDAHLRDRRDEYDRRHERVVDSDDRTVYLVPRGHWVELGARVDLDRREVDAVRRAHRQQLLRHGRDGGRREEFETALEIREAVVLGRGEDGNARED